MHQLAILINGVLEYFIDQISSVRRGGEGRGAERERDLM